MYMKMTLKKINAYEKKKRKVFLSSLQIYFFSFCFFSFLPPSPVAPLTPASVSTHLLSLLVILLSFWNVTYICREESSKLQMIGWAKQIWKKNYLFLSSEGNTTPWAWKIPVRVFWSFNFNALPLQGCETFNQLVFLNWISENFIMKILVNRTLP